MPPAPTLQQLLTLVQTATNEKLLVLSQPSVLSHMVRGLTPDEIGQFLLAKNIKHFGGINEYVTDFLTKTIPAIASMPSGSVKENVKQGQRSLIERMLKVDGLTEENKSKLEAALSGEFAAAAAGGKRKWKMPRKMTRRYCKKTSCRKMGFTQKASCRPWKNCF